MKNHSILPDMEKNTEKFTEPSGVRMKPSTKKMLKAITLLTSTTEQQFIDDALQVAFNQLPKNVLNRLKLLTELKVSH